MECAAAIAASSSGATVPPRTALLRSSKYPTIAAGAKTMILRLATGHRPYPKPVRRTGRDEDERACRAGVLLLAEEDPVLAVEHVERLGSVRVPVHGRTEARGFGGLEQGKRFPGLRAAGRFHRHLEPAEVDLPSL